MEGGSGQLQGRVMVVCVGLCVCSRGVGVGGGVVCV